MIKENNEVLEFVRSFTTDKDVQEFLLDYKVDLTVFAALIAIKAANFVTKNKKK